MTIGFLDIGNTLAKGYKYRVPDISNFFSPIPLSAGRFTAEELEPLAFPGMDDCEEVVVSGSADIHSLAARLQSRLPQRRVMTFDTSTPLPVDIDYATTGTLGFDRVVNAAGATAIKRINDESGKDPANQSDGPADQRITSAVVADAGTALTIDFIDFRSERPAFRGGNISLGLGGRLKALHEYTVALPLVDPVETMCALEKNPPGHPWGNSTDSAITLGCIQGMGDEISGAFRRMDAFDKDGRTLLILTGGDAPLLRPAIGLPHIYYPQLQGLGLTEIYIHNKKQT